MNLKTCNLYVLLIPLLMLTGCEPRKTTPAAPAPVEMEKSIGEIIREGDTTALIAWLEHGDANAIQADGKTPLHLAALYGRATMVSLLLDAGADPTLVNADGLAAYDLAIMSGKADAAAALAEARSIYLSLIKGEATPPEPAVETNIPPALLLSTDFRTWSSAGGDRIEAAFIQNIFDTVILQGRDGEFFRIALHRLTPADQSLVRQLSGLDPHALAGARPRAIASPRPRDSLALRMGRDKGWTVLENCRLIKRSGNDGDSFHVRHEGKEYIFRLYFVDAAETSLSYPDRVKDQSKYFDLKTADTIALGEAAAKFTSTLLASGPFTVVTRWEDARGNSRLPRHYAMINTTMGDLDELLAKEGLVRRYGMPVQDSLGQRKQSALKQLEEEARRNRAGAWAKSR